MNWHIRFKPKPRYLRDRLELWIIRISDGWTLRYNLSGLFPFIGIPIGALFGAIVSFVIDSRPEIGWHEGVRYAPTLLGAALGFLIPEFAKRVICQDYYEHDMGERDQGNLQRILTKLHQPARQKGSRRRKSVRDED